MKALTLNQPWASLIARGAKSYETRDWPPPVHLIGRHLAIHAAREASTAVKERLPPEAVEAISAALGTDNWRSLPCSQIVCTTRLRAALLVANTRRYEHQLAIDGAEMGLDTLGHHTSREARRMICGRERHFGNYAVGRWLWELVEIRPVMNSGRVQGHQRLWDWQPERSL